MNDWEVFWKDGCAALSYRGVTEGGALTRARVCLDDVYDGPLYPHVVGCVCADITEPREKVRLERALHGTALGRLCGLP